MPTDTAARWARLRLLARIGQHPSAILLLGQLLALLAYPFVEGTPAGAAWFGAFGAVVLLLAMRMVHRTAGHARFIVALALAVPAVASNLVATAGGVAWLAPWSAMLEALFYFHAAACLVAYMLADRRATSDELFAAGATFTLLAWAFAHVFMACQALQPGCFGAVIDAAAPRSWTELLFLSFVLLSSTGIGDVVPLTPHARALASLEIFIGVMYLTLVVSRLIGLTVLSRSER
ncbi:MAG: ion channel [Dokdonella sp.]|uniref:ion channel n=1 Tax=Dokdonella sp. TaxID=2291710 RepID=UPI003F7F3D32